jgi:hypothetical protein
MSGWLKRVVRVQYIQDLQLVTFNGWNTPRMLPFPEYLSSYGMQQVRSFERCNHVVVKPSSGPGAWSAVTLFAVWKSGMAISDHKDS